MLQYVLNTLQLPLATENINTNELKFILKQQIFYSLNLIPSVISSHV